MQISCPLQPRDHTGDRATGQARDRAQIAAGHRPAVTEQVEALVIRWAEPQALRDRVVKQHYRRAVLARQPPHDLPSQFLLALACSPHRISSHMFQYSLVTKLSAK